MKFELQQPSGTTAAASEPVMTQTLWIALPAYNEALALPDLLTNLATVCKDTEVPFGIIVVDDGSSDDTVDVVRGVMEEIDAVRLVQHPKNLGLAAALRTGLTAAAKQARADDVILTMDSDGTHPADLIPQMLDELNRGNDVVTASRFRPGARVIGLSFDRHLLSLAARICFTTTFPTKGIRDYTGGYRIFRAAAIQDAMEFYGADFVTEQGFSCTVDLLLKLRKRGARFGEVPMILRYDQKQGESKMKVYQTCVDTLKLIARRRMGSNS